MSKGHPITAVLAKGREYEAIQASEILLSMNATPFASIVQSQNLQ